LWVHVIVVGAGEVGSYVADRLSREGHDVAIVDKDVTRLQQLSDDLDVLTIAGSGTHPRTLEAAGVSHADLLVAVTSNDEVNLISSHYRPNRSRRASWRGWRTCAQSIRGRPRD
jgi:trk system potassium uptake protein TrkA